MTALRVKTRGNDPAPVPEDYKVYKCPHDCMSASERMLWYVQNLNNGEHKVVFTSDYETDPVAKALYGFCKDIGRNVEVVNHSILESDPMRLIDDNLVFGNA